MDINTGPKPQTGTKPPDVDPSALHRVAVAIHYRLGCLMWMVAALLVLVFAALTILSSVVRVHIVTGPF